MTKSFGGEFYAQIDYLKKDECTLEFNDNSISQVRTSVDGEINVNCGFNRDNGWSLQALKKKYFRGTACVLRAGSLVQPLWCIFDQPKFILRIIRAALQRAEVVWPCGEVQILSVRST